MIGIDVWSSGDREVRHGTGRPKLPMSFYVTVMVRRIQQIRPRDGVAIIIRREP